MKGLKKYLHNREEAINLLLEKPFHSFTPSTFHNLRVEIKKLNAFFELIESCSKDFKRNKAIRPFRQIFSQAGKVREIQMEEMLLKKYFSNSLLTVYRKDLRTQKKIERAALFSLINEATTVRVKKSFHYSIPFLATIDKKKVHIYLNEQRKKITKHFFHHDLKPDQIHDLRKLLKRYNYNKNIAIKGIPSPSSKKQAELTDLLGKWHDSQVICLKFDKVIAADGIDPDEIIQIKNIMTRISSENELVLSRIKTAISASEIP